jgi:6-pyruvoyltetrahydropterin/6-carboxytetrahydropterin synthase
MIVNLNDIKPILAGILQPLDGAFLNDLSAFHNASPTLENLVQFLWRQMPAQLENATLARLCLQESPHVWIETSNHFMKLTRKYEFAAAHRLHAPTLSEDENTARYGKCNNPRGHGHNYGLEVTVEGTPDAASGVLIAPHEMDALVETEVFERFDHKHLNEDCPEFENLIPTSENLARVIFDILAPKIKTDSRRLAKIGLHETQKNYFEVEAAVSA